MLDLDREDAIKALNTGEHIFLTGAAGSGKTYLAKEYAKESKRNVALTATTGIAALNLGGETIHRFLGIGILNRPEQADKIIKRWNKIKVSSTPWDKERWKMMNKLDAIVIDEASMLRRDQFELIEVVLSHIKDSTQPFGGVQMILVGDFFQLPPVVQTYEVKQYPELDSPYCFQSDLWRHCSFKSVNLTTNYRQSDQEFLDVLNKIRIGKIDDQVNEVMQARVDVAFEGPIKPVIIFTHKSDVRNENIRCLKELNNPVFKSEADYSGKDIFVDMLKKNCQAEHELYFCNGAQVMMLTNDPADRWVNGTLGIIQNADPLSIMLSNGNVISPVANAWEKVIHKVVNDKWVSESVATMKQLPFKLSWAATVHKTQGLTIDYADIDLQNCFASGQAYVALSRVKTLQGLSLRNWNSRSISADGRVAKFYSIDRK